MDQTGKKLSGDVAHCANCGAVLTGVYCAACGQSSEDIRRPAWSLLTDLIGSIFVWEGRFFSTLRAIYTRPGQVARAYIDGQRNTYTAPIRLYVIVSVGFFMIMAASGMRVVGVDVRPDADTVRAQDPTVIAARLDSLRAPPDSAPPASSPPDRPEEADAGDYAGSSTAQGVPLPTCGVLPGTEEINASGQLVYARDTSVGITLFLFGPQSEGRVFAPGDETCLETSLRSMGAPPGFEHVSIAAIQNPDLFEARIATATSQALVLMVVAFALLNLLLHPRRRMIEHAVYSLYWHAAFLPLATLSAVLSRYARDDTILALGLAVLTLGAVSLIQLLSDRGFYGSSWIGALLRLPAFILGYTATVAFVALGLIMLRGL